MSQIESIKNMQSKGLAGAERDRGTDADRPKDGEEGHGVGRTAAAKRQTDYGVPSSIRQATNPQRRCPNHAQPPAAEPRRLAKQPAAISDSGCAS